MHRFFCLGNLHNVHSYALPQQIKICGVDGLDTLYDDHQYDHLARHVYFIGNNLDIPLETQLLFRSVQQGHSLMLHDVDEAAQASQTHTSFGGVVVSQPQVPLSTTDVAMLVPGARAFPEPQPQAGQDVPGNITALP